jgi:glycosyltransferase involved in cell wall biosynthesis
VNILVLDQFSELGGAQQCLLDLVPAVQDDGWKMTCAVPGNGPLVAKLRAHCVSVHSLALGSFTSDRKPALDVLRFGLQAPRLARDISHLAGESHADLLYVNGPRVLPAAAWAARKTGRPLLFHCHSHLAQRSAAMMAGRSLQLSNARVIACCRYVARPLWPYIDPGRLRVIFSGVAPQNTARPRHKSCLRIGVIGRISPEKGQIMFIRSARLLAAKHPDCKFVVCGAPLSANPEAARYSAQVRELATGLPVEFLGWREDVPAVLASLDALVVPSSREGLPRVILEAFAARVPVIAFVTGGIPEIVTEGETGFLVEPPTAETLAEKLDSLLRKPEQLDAAADRAFEAWKENFTLDRYRRDALAAIGTAASG